MSESIKRFLLLMTALFLLTACAPSDIPSSPAASLPESVELPAPTETGAAETTPAETAPAENISTEPSYYTVGDILCPALLGPPLLDQDAVALLYQADDFLHTSQAITNICDAFSFMRHAGRSETSEDAAILLSSLITGDYDEVGVIRFRFPDSSYCLVYVEESGQYFGFDPWQPDSNWPILPENNCLDSKFPQHLAKSLAAVFPHSQTPPEETELFNMLGNSHGAVVCYFDGYGAPIRLGLPQLTDTQINDLMEEKDYEKAAQTICTLADAIRYCAQSLQYDDTLPSWKPDEFQYFQSSWQILNNGKGHWAALPNLIHYLLQGDYDEVGYLHVRSDTDWYVMTHIRDKGIHYLYNPQEHVIINPSGSWLVNFPFLTGCAADFQTIADSLVRDVPLEDGSPIHTVHLIRSPGDFIVGRQGNRCLYPEGTEVTEYYGSGFAFSTARYDWQSQKRLVP